MGHDGVFRKSAARFGGLLGAAGIELVYGGGRVGLMGSLADAALAAGGRVTGVIPTDLKRAELAHPGISELVVVDTMHDRKREMFKRADAFVALPGGPGTLDETIEVLTWRQLRLHDKPVVVVNQDGYWQPLLDLLEHTIAQGFARDRIHALYQAVDDVADVLPALARMPAPHARERADRI